jgi:hypothetical protein
VDGVSRVPVIKHKVKLLPPTVVCRTPLWQISWHPRSLLVAFWFSTRHPARRIGSSKYIETNQAQSQDPF